MFNVSPRTIMPGFNVREPGLGVDSDWAPGAVGGSYANEAATAPWPTPVGPVGSTAQAIHNDWFPLLRSPVMASRGRSKHVECVAESSPSGGLQSSEFRKCDR